MTMIVDFVNFESKFFFFIYLNAVLKDIFLKRRDEDTICFQKSWYEEN